MRGGRFTARRVPPPHRPHRLPLPRPRPPPLPRLPRLPAARGPAAVVHQRAARPPGLRLRRARQLLAAPRRHALSGEPGQHGVLHRGQHAARPRRPAGPRGGAQPRRAPHRAPERLLLSVHALGGHRRAHLALAPRPRGRAVQLLPARARAAGALVAGPAVDGDVGDHRHHRVVGHRLLPRHLPGGAPGHSARAVRGGHARRRQRRGGASGPSRCRCSSRCSCSWS